MTETILNYSHFGQSAVVREKVRSTELKTVRQLRNGSQMKLLKRRPVPPALKTV